MSLTKSERREKVIADSKKKVKHVTKCTSCKCKFNKLIEYEGDFLCAPCMSTRFSQDIAEGDFIKQESKEKERTSWW